MAINNSDSLLLSERATPSKADAAAAALGDLARLLARQAVREVMASDPAAPLNSTRAQARLKPSPLLQENGISKA